MPIGTSDERRISEARLNAVIKSARDIMRKDAGLNGDLDRLPQLSWLLFLRAFDAAEDKRKILERSSFQPAIKEEYRWRKWAHDPDFTGEHLLRFVNDELLPYLAGLHGPAGDPRNVLSAVFKEIHNRMLSGYLLRDLINAVDQINFNSSDDIHVMAKLYEKILGQMRDAAGDSGEFYTPRPVIRFMVQQSFLDLGQIILDPACGTGGFLVESYETLHQKVKSSTQERALHSNLRGIEKKPLPYLLCMMNLLLHDIENPAVLRGNALAELSAEVGWEGKVDVILTNPPFGGEEESSISERFQAGLRTKETAWLYVQGVLNRLRGGGRCAIVLPNGVLFSDGVGARIKARLIKECNLHTVVRLPQGVFAPYTLIPSNLLFFDKGEPTKEIWFYELSPPEGRRGYTKTKPLRFEEFDACADWWSGKEREGREENDHAWRVSIADLQASNYNLDLTNPNAGDDLAHRPPEELIKDLITTEREILTLLTDLEKTLGGAE